MYLTLFLFTLALVVPNVYCGAVDCTAPPPKVRHSFCCTSLIKFPLMKKELLEECGHDGQRDRPRCAIIQCAFKSAKLLESSGNVNQTAFLAYMVELYGSGWSSSIKKTIDTCVGEMNPGTDSCAIRQFMTCFRRKLVLSCPTADWNNTTDCTNLKAFIQSCPKS